MNKLIFKSFYKRNLPHIQMENMVYFITFRLAFNLPNIVTSTLEKEKEDYEEVYKNIEEKEKNQFRIEFYKKRFYYIDQILDRFKYADNFLQNEDVANIVKKTLFFFDKKKYHLISFCIMPNHVHMLVQILKKDEVNFYSLSEIMHSIKRSSALDSNRILKRTGQFWHHESYDHIIRNETEFNETLDYIRQNPVKAGLVRHPEEWIYNYISDEFFIQ